MVLGFHVQASSGTPNPCHCIVNSEEEQQGQGHGQATTASSAPSVGGSGCGPFNGFHHPVLNNGRSIKHLATQSGYATALDGVRLFYELYECPLRQASNSPTTSQTAQSTRWSGIAAPYSLSEMSVNRSTPLRTLPTSNCGSYSSQPPLPGACASSPSAGAVAAVLSDTATAVKSPKGPCAEAVEVAELSSARAGEELQALRLAPAAVALCGPAENVLDGGQSAAVWGPEGAPAGARGTGEEGLSETAGLSSNSVDDEAAAPCAEEQPGVANVLLIMGFAAGRDGWLPLIHHWMSQEGSEPLRRLHTRFCMYDNRGIGDSDSPPARSNYSTQIMARDALAVMDHLGWSRAHVVGFSMGGMVALRLAAAAPDRLLSLTALSITNGGWQVLPTRWRALRLLLGAAAARTAHQRAHADVHFHFSRDTLHVEVPASGSMGGGSKTGSAPTQRVQEALVEEYVATSQSAAPQPHAGMVGQLHAVWTHGLTAAEHHQLRQLQVPFKVLHGHHDMMAMPHYGERIAKHARAAFVMLKGGHFIARECAPQVCMHIADSLVSTQTFR